MKKILVVLMIGVVLISCGNDDENGKGEGYLISLEQAKNGIIGIWANEYSTEYTSYRSDGQSCFGYPADNLRLCMKYEVFKKDNDYILRVYYVGDTEGTGSFTDAKILKLDESELVFFVTEEYKYIRYIE